MNSAVNKPNLALTFIFITILLDVIGLGIIIPVTPRLIEELTGGSISDAAKYGGWLMFAYAIMQFAFSSLIGSLSDTYGRRPILLISLFGLGIDYIFQAMSPTIVWLFVGRIIAGISGASYSTATAYISDISSPEKKAQNFGLVGAAFGIGFVIGPVIGGVCANWGSRMPFIVAAILTLINFAFGYFILPESLDKTNRRPFNINKANPFGSFKALQKYPLVAGLILAEFFIYLASKAVESNWTYFTKFMFNWNETTIGLSLGFVGVLIALVQGWLIRIIIPKIGEKRSVFIGFSIEVISLILFSLAFKEWMMFAILVPYAFGGIAGPALQSLVSNQVPNNEQGELQGLVNTVQSITYIIGPLMMNGLFYYFTYKNAPVQIPGAPFILGGILALVGLIISFSVLRKKI